MTTSDVLVQKWTESSGQYSLRVTPTRSSHAASVVLFPHRADARRYHALLQGRPLWYLLLRSEAFQVFLQSQWLEYLFPVAMDNFDASLASADNATRAAQSHAVQPPFSVLGVTCTPLASGPYGEALPLGGRQEGPQHRSYQPPAANYAQAPTDTSTERTESLGTSRAAYTIPTAFPNMSSKRETLLRQFRDLVGNHKPARLTASGSDSGPTTLSSQLPSKKTLQHPKDAYAFAAIGVAPTSTLDQRAASGERHRGLGTSVLVGTAVNGSNSASPLSPSPRVASASLLRDEVFRARVSSPLRNRDDSPSRAALVPLTGAEPSSSLVHESSSLVAAPSAPSLLPLTYPIAAEEEQGNISSTSPVLRCKYRAWIATSRSRSQRERVVEVSEALAVAMRHQRLEAHRPVHGDSEAASYGNALLSLLADVLLHPVQARKRDIEAEWLATGDDSGVMKQDAAKAANRFLNPSELALLELSVFGYTPRDAASPFEDAALSESPLLSSVEDLVRSRDGIAKHSLVPEPTVAATVELMLRNSRLRSALRIWWEHLPKRHRPGSAVAAVCDEDHERAEEITRQTFVQLSLLLHSAFIGRSLPWDDSETLADLRELMESDWFHLFVPTTTHTAGVGSRCGSAGPSTQQFRSLMAKGLECPMSITLPLFEVALLLLLEPWMETTLVEERELALALLFPQCFVPSGLGPSRIAGEDAIPESGLPGRPQSHFMLRQRGVHSLKAPVVEQGHCSTTVSRLGSAQRRASPGVGSIPTSPIRRAVSAGAARARSPMEHLAELTTQLDAAGDLRLARKQAARNAKEASDVALRYNNGQWHTEILKSRLLQKLPMSRLKSASERLPAGSGEQHQQPAEVRRLTAATPVLHNLKKTFAPHDPAVAYGLERVMLQRLTRRVAQCDDALQVTAAVQANIVVHAAKTLISPDYLHQIATYHRTVVEEFRNTVAAAAALGPPVARGSREGNVRVYAAKALRLIGSDRTSSHASEAFALPDMDIFQRAAEDDGAEQPSTNADDFAHASYADLTSPFIVRTPCDGEDDRVQSPPLPLPSEPPALVDAKALAAVLAPPELPQYRAETVFATQKHPVVVPKSFVRRPTSSQRWRSSANNLVGQDTREDQEYIAKASSSLQRPLSAIHAQRMAAQTRPGVVDRLESKTNNKVRKCTAGATDSCHRPTSASNTSSDRQRSPEVVFISPFMNRGALPITNGGAFSAQLSAAGARPSSGGVQRH